MLSRPTLCLLALIAACASVTAQTASKKRDLSKGNTLYVVPYAHLDTQWRWAYPQVIREFIPNTLNRNFELIEKYPHYVFNFSGSRRYEFMKQYYPADYERLKGYVKAGRWFPAGSSVDEGDANVPSAESLIRHVLYGNRFFRREFGVASREFMLPDCFGFPYALPSILAHCGVEGFSTQKLTWGSAVGIPFKVGVWQGPDGKGVVAALDPGSYSADVTEDLSQNTSWLARIQNTGKKSGAYVDYHYYGTGDIGGGPRPLAVDWVEKSIAGKGPITVVSSKSDEMFASLTPKQIEKLPRYQGELLLTEHSAGSITSQAYMKRWNRKNELLADAAERASVAAMWLGGLKYPSERLYNAWDLVLGSQMHDMLPGTSIPKAYEFCWNDELLALNQFAAMTTDAVASVSSALDTQTEGQALVVYNPLSIARQDVVEAGIAVPENAQVVMHGPDGKRVNTQEISRSNGKARILFLADVPPLSFSVFDARVVPAGGMTTDLQMSPNTLDNARFRVKLSDDGDIASIFDKAANREILKSPTRLDFQYHNPRSFPAWNMDWEHAKLPPQSYVKGPAKIKVVEHGEVRMALEVEREANGSRFVQTIRLAAGGAGDRVEVSNLIDWQTKEHALKAEFPLAVANPKATYELQVGTIQRDSNDEKKYEVPQHQWFDLSQPDGKYGVAILNDSKYGSDKPSDDTVRLTMIYTPGVRGGYWDQETQDFGRHEILYAIAPHSGDWQAANVPWQARRLNQPLKAFEVPKHAGGLGRSFSLVSASTSQVEISAVKKAEDGDRIIVRLRELQGRPATNVQIKLMSDVVSAEEVDGQERPISKAAVRSGALVTDVPAYSLRAFAISLAKPSVHVAQPQAQQLALDYDADVASSAAKPADGTFAIGESLAAELLPERLSLGGIEFKLGSTADGAKNALIARGQTLSLPQGYSKLHLLLAADQDVATEFKIGGKTVPVTVQAWDGYVGQWDNRLWNEDVGQDFDNYTEWKGLVQGYVKHGEVAWFSNHKRDAKAGNRFYEYSYLYKQSFDLAPGDTSFTLANDPRIKVLAASVAKDEPEATPAAPLYDALQTGRPSIGPGITPEGGDFNDATLVTLHPPLYWKAGALRYTTDGSTPTAASPAYEKPMTLYSPTTLNVAEVDPQGHVGLLTTAFINVNDMTPPKVLSATSPKSLGVVRVLFSEAISRETAEAVESYRLGSGAKVTEAKLSDDGKTVDLTLAGALPANAKEDLVIKGIEDRAPTGNAIVNQSIEIAERGAVFTSPPLEPKKSQSFKVDGLPVKTGDAWTLNLWCKPNSDPEHLTMIAGFGRATDGRTGTGRYFTRFTRGINFWVSNKDVGSTTQLDLGKWQMLTASYDGMVMRIYKNGDLIAEQAVELEDDRSQVEVMPLDAWEKKRMFDGEVQNLTIWNEGLSETAIKRLMEQSRPKK